MNARTSYKVRVCFEEREDGGLRAWSEDLPELVLSHADAARVIADVPVAMQVILEHRFGGPVLVETLETLPASGDAPAMDRTEACAKSREFAARAA